jgi:hypothetical protein
MTRNEKIAEKMGWEGKLHPRTGFTYIYPSGFNINQIGEDSKEGHWLAHLLIERMVGDGVQFVYAQDDEHGTSATAYKLNSKAEWDEFTIQIKTHNLADFPAAVVELFCRVYGIKED